jgi:hypothetical protein
MNKMLVTLDQYIFKPLRQFFLKHLRFSTVAPIHLGIFVLGLSLLLLLMLSTTHYLINFLGALLLLPFAAMLQTIVTLENENKRNTTKFTLALLLLTSESLVYLGALIYNSNIGDPVFTFIAGLSIIGLWFYYFLFARSEIQMLPLELRYFLLALTTLLTLNFIYFLIFLVIVCSQIITEIRPSLKK